MASLDRADIVWARTVLRLLSSKLRGITIIDTQKEDVAPPLVFIDPFGFSHTPFKTISNILKNSRCEVLVNFMYEEVNRFLSVEKHSDDYDQLFGTAEWRTVINLSAGQGRKAIHDIYLKQLKTAAQYVHSFEMLNKGNSTDCFLFFATNSLKGLEKMKEAMWKVDDTGPSSFLITTMPVDSCPCSARTPIWRRFEKQF